MPRIGAGSRWWLYIALNFAGCVLSLAAAILFESPTWTGHRILFLGFGLLLVADALLAPDDVLLPPPVGFQWLGVESPRVIRSVTGLLGLVILLLVLTGLLK